jgi:hypothetical protein
MDSRPHGLTSCLHPILEEENNKSMTWGGSIDNNARVPTGERTDKVTLYLGASGQSTYRKHIGPAIKQVEVLARWSVLGRNNSVINQLILYDHSPTYKVHSFRGPGQRVVLVCLVLRIINVSPDNQRSDARYLFLLDQCEVVFDHITRILLKHARATTQARRRMKRSIPCFAQAVTAHCTLLKTLPKVAGLQLRLTSAMGLYF